MVRSTRDVSEAGHYKRGGFAFQTRAVAGESRNPPGQCASSTGSGLEQCSPQLSGVGAWCAGGGSKTLKNQRLSPPLRESRGRISASSWHALSVIRTGSQALVRG